MFESLQDGLTSALKTLQGKARLTEANMREGLGMVEQSLLEADVSYSVVKDFIGRVAEKATGEKVLLALNPAQQVIKIVHDELINILGPVDPAIPLKKDLTVLMMCGLQGSGKTTTCGKLAQLLKKNKVSVMLCAADLQRPAAIEQLHVLGRQLDIPVYSEVGAQDPVKVCQDAAAKAKQTHAQVLILDTAGRLAIDQELMDQLVRIDKRVHPDQVFLVVDGMTGQDAVNSAKAFNEALELDGVIMTKLDGDTRGGALLSVKHVTGVPIKFIGTGEHLDSLEPFRPEGMASRILGMGDVLGLVDVVQRNIDAKQQAELEAKLKAGEFTLDDFKGQLKQIAQPGLMMKMMKLLPGMGELSKMMEGMDAEGEVKRKLGIIDAMTAAERRSPKLIDPSRRNRIAKGAGVPVQEVNSLLKEYDMMAPLVKSMAGKGVGGRMAALQEMQRSGMLNPGAKSFKPKGDTGRRLTAKEREELRKKREKELRKKKREQKDNKKKDDENDDGQNGSPFRR
jgi:signal recognition particle subunit SRP54